MNSARLFHPYFPTVFVGWDNTPRRGRKGLVVTNNTPEHFGNALRDAIVIVKKFSHEEQILFINAWNEWAEGNHLELDLKSGHAYLEQVRAVVLE